MRVTKKVIAAVLILCMMMQISGTAVIAADAANSRSTEISDAAVEAGGEPIHAVDIVSVSVEGGKSGASVGGASASAAGGESASSASGASASAAGGEFASSAGGASASVASEASAAGKDTFSTSSEETYAQSQGEERSSADEGLSAEPSQAVPEVITNRTELSDKANEADAADTVSESGKTDDGTEELTGNGKAAGDEDADEDEEAAKDDKTAGNKKAAKDEKASENKKVAKDEKAAGDEDADEDEKSAGDEKDAEDEKAFEDKEETTGNITAKDAGIVLEGGGKFDILVAGTLKTQGTPILIDKTVDPDNVSITVWKIEEPVQAGGKNEKHVVLEGKLGETQAVTNASKKVEAGIRYIIKIEPSQEKLINLEGTEQSHGYNTAKEGETVTLKISVPDGYKLIGAYNGDGDKVPLKKDDHGNYYVVVPKAGGVYLSAEFEENSDDDEDDDDEEDECSGRRTESVCSYADRSRDREECDLAGKCNRIIYDLNGGTLNGDKGPIIVQAELDKEYKLLDAPKKPGARFLRWASSCKDVRVSKPGDAFVFEHCVKFTAVWDDDSAGRCGRHKVRKDCDDEEDDAEEDDDEDDEDTEENDDGPDVTKTVRIKEANDEELNINSIKVDDNPAVGIEIIAARDVDVDEDITVTGGDQGATGIKASAEGKSVTSEVETGSGMKVKSEGSSVGIEASASDGGSLSVDFEGSIDVSSGSGSSVGISAHADSGSSVSIEVG